MNMSTRQMKRVVKKRMGHEQFQTLLAYMEQHSLFARGQIMKLGPQGHIKFQNMWTELTSQLNKIGPSKKNVTEWQNTWKNLKSSAKQRKAHYLKAYNKTGNSKPDMILKEEDNRIMDIYGKYAVGFPLIAEAGFNKTKSIIMQQVFKKRATNLKNFSNCCYEENKKIIRPTNEQKEALMVFMENHEVFAKELSSGEEEMELWAELVSLLNALGPARNLKSWQKSWSDSVKAARQSLTFLNKGLRDTPVTDHHSRILQLVGLQFSEDLFSNGDDSNNSTTTPSKLSYPVKQTVCTSTITSSHSPLSNILSKSSLNTSTSSRESRSTGSIPSIPSTSSNNPNITESFTLGTKRRAVESNVTNKADAVISAFHKKQLEILQEVKKSFEKQTEQLLDQLAQQTQLLMSMPKVIEKSFQKALNNFFVNNQLTSHTASENEIDPEDEATYPVEMLDSEILNMIQDENLDN